MTKDERRRCQESSSLDVRNFHEMFMNADCRWSCECSCECSCEWGCGCGCRCGLGSASQLITVSVSVSEPIRSHKLNTHCNFPLKPRALHLDPCLPAPLIQLRAQMMCKYANRVRVVKSWQLEARCRVPCSLYPGYLSRRALTFVCQPGCYTLMLHIHS